MPLTTEQKIQGVNDSIKGSLTGVNDLIKASATKIASPILGEISGALGKICPIMGAIGGVLGVFNLFHPDPFQHEVLDGLKKIQDQLNDIEKDMDTHFDQLETLINLDFLQNKLDNTQRAFNLQAAKFPVNYWDGGTGDMMNGGNKVDKNDANDKWSEYIGLNTNVSGQPNFYLDMARMEVSDLISQISTLLTGVQNGTPDSDAIKLSLLGLLTDKAIYQMGMSNGQVKDFVKRGCIEEVQSLLDHYNILESFFYRNFMIQYKTYKMWHDAMIYRNSVAYPVDATVVADDGSSNVVDVIHKKEDDYKNVSEMPDFICLGRMDDTYVNSYDLEKTDLTYAQRINSSPERTIDLWDTNVLHPNVSGYYTSNEYNAYFQPYKDGTLTYTDDQGKTQKNPLFLFVNKNVMGDIQEVRNHLLSQLDLFVFQMERLVVSQMNFFAFKYSGDKVGPFVIAANEVLARAEYLRQSLSGNLFSFKAPASEAIFLTGRVVLPKNVDLASSSMEADGDLGLPVENDYPYGYGYDADKNGFGYQFPILDNGVLQSYANSPLKIITFNFKPDSKACSLIPGCLSVMMGLRGGNYDGIQQGGTIYPSTIKLGDTTRTLYSFFVTPLFGSFNALNDYVSQAVMYGDYSKKGSWSGGVSLHYPEMNQFTILGHTDPSNGADNSDVLKMLGVSIPVHFNENHALYIWVKSSLKMDVSFYQTTDTHEELDLDFTVLGTPIPVVVFMDGISVDEQAPQKDKVVLVGQNCTIQIDTDDYFDTTNTGAFRQTVAESAFYKCAINGLCRSDGTGNLIWMLDAKGGPNHFSNQGVYAMFGPHDYTFDGSFNAVLSVEEIRFFWDMPDVSKFVDPKAG